MAPTAVLEAPAEPEPRTEDMTLVELIHEMARSHQQDEYPSRAFNEAYSRALTLARLVTGESPVPPAVESHPLFAVQQLGGITREWALVELASGGFQVLTRTRCTGRMGPWARSGNPIEARDREQAARACGERYRDRARIQWTATEDGEWAAEGAAGRERVK